MVKGIVISDSVSFKDTRTGNDRNARLIETDREIYAIASNEIYRIGRKLPDSRNVMHLVTNKEKKERIFRNYNLKHISC